ncbi:MAG: hypothetical protein DKM50_06625 [Candidatus Margulisiibacteriota bacterium]|nr:MAG: hypothetical protein A2X43_00385 [Candidatus Margulisbacteria bacterium GWD2_39_127]OGI04315.1 MAG: hypothetical protein A2X42_05290 [Candidatus Margulisbacteria bacterium GWF2_38_17]OGI11780.1 MAG: hypothetical protein A2X41_10960 [Candidatus Margulisbacteria bacterium GWE2_39_32]PZM79851.1 MAG: hypothetical protein DKM50_06625 [Candidatus Margulisiibacteriota bacterium]HAR62761.1 hypothetical protein [Candidatus Margulisiibacteriota bacterium]
MDKQLAEWLFYVDSDLKSALIILESRENIYHISIYHAHQAVEKAMKAFLISKGVEELPKIHSLLKLFSMILKYGFDENMKTDIIELDSYYPKVRYPYGDQISYDDALICYKIAEQICSSIITKINNK